MHRLAALALLPTLAQAEGAVGRFECEVMGCAGDACLAQGALFELTIQPEQVNDDGTGDFTVSLPEGDFLGTQIAPQGPLVWTEGAETVAFLHLPPDRSVFTLHRYSAHQGEPDAVTTHYVSCWVN